MNEYREYLNESPTVFFKCKNEHGWPVEFASENVFDIFGYKSKDFTTNKVSFLDLVYENDKQQLLEEVQTVAEALIDKYEFTPYRAITKNKNILWVQDITKVVKNNENKVTHFYCYITDITNQIKLSKKLSATEDIISTIYNNSFQFIGLMKTDGTLIRANKTSLEFANIKEEDVIGKKFWDCPWWQHSKKDQKALKKDIKKAAKGKFVKDQKVHYDDKGNKIYVDFSIKPVFNDKKEVIFLIPEGHNITDKVNQDKILKRYMNIIDENVLVSTTDLEGKIISCSNKFTQLSGFSKEELYKHRHNIMKHPDNDEFLYKDLWKTITQGKTWKGIHKNISKKGKVFFVENIITPNLDKRGNIESYTSIYNDITSQKEISELLITDSLTNIYNRRHFNTIFEAELKRSQRHNYNFVLMILDIDYFKQYNDIYGHHAGDEILIEVASCIKNSLHRSEDYAFRLGGEEFAVITSDISKKGIMHLAKTIKKNIKNLKIKHKGSDISKYLTTSIGIKTVDKKKDLDYETIFKEADDALYVAKAKGRNTIIKV